MNKIKHKIYLIATLILFCTFSAQAQTETKGKDFWFSFGQMLGEYSSDNLTMQIRIAADQAASGEITFMGMTSNKTISFSVPAKGVFTHTLTASQRTGSYTYYNSPTNNSVHITSDVPVSVYALNSYPALADATLILPTSALGTDYYHLGRKSTETDPVKKFDQYFVVATQNNTTIYENGANVKTLSAGQVYLKQTSTLKDMSGTHVTSNHPIAYFSAHSYCNIGGGGENFFQQLAPVNMWGKNFQVPVTNRTLELVRIVASQNNTTITQTGGTIMTIEGGQASLKLNAGQWVELKVTLANKGCYIQADKPVQVCSYMVGGLYSGATKSGDESLCWITPMEQSVESILMAPFATTQLTTHYALIVTPTITKNNTKVSIGTAAPATLSGGTWYDNTASGMSFYNVALTNSTASYIFTNPAGLTAYGYGYGNAISYYYMAGTALHDLSVGFSVNNVNHLKLPTTIFNSSTVNFKAEIEGTMSTAQGHLKWYIDGVEQTAFRDSVTWTNHLPPGVYLLKMEVVLSNNSTKTVESKLIIENISDVERCTNAPTTFVATPHNAGNILSYQWQVNGHNISGETHQRYIYTPTVEDTISCKLTYDYPCLGLGTVLSNKLVVKQGPMPGSLTQPNDTIVCAGETVTVNFTGIDINESLCTWTNSNPNIGLAANGTGVISFVATNTGADPELAEITVTPASSAGCEDQALAQTFTITVNPMPAAFTKIDDQIVCDGEQVTVNFTGAGVFADSCVWSNSNPNIGLAPSDTGNISFTATNTSHYAATATIVVTPISSAGCVAPGLYQTFEITVRALPSSFNFSVRDTTICEGTTLNLDYLATSNGVENVDFKWYETESAPTPILSKIITPNETRQYFLTMEGDNYCETTPADRLPVTITVTEKSIPEFGFETTLKYCLNAVPFILPEISDNGIAGTWSPDSISTSQIGEKTYTFTPNSGECFEGAGIVYLQIEVSDIPNPEYVVKCNKTPENTANLEVTAPIGDIYKYSVDGDKFQLSPIFPNLPNGDYRVYVLDTITHCMSISDTIKIECVTEKFTLYGTVFPFVHSDDEAFDNLFTITARLYSVPSVTTGANPIKALLQNAPLYETTAFYYNGEIHVPGTPLNPGTIGEINNPGKEINWEPVGYTSKSGDTTSVKEGEVPTKPVGIYMFTNVVEGSYILMLSAPGFAYRYGKITVNSNTSLGHRELIPGDINGDALIDHRDLGIVNGRYATYPEKRYNLMFDLNKDGKVDEKDSKLIIDTYGGFSSMFYQETWDWMFSY